MKTLLLFYVIAQHAMRVNIKFNTSLLIEQI